MKCDICGEVNDAVEIHMCKQCANKFSDNVNRIKRDLAIYKRALELACKDRCHRCYSMVTGTCQYDPKTYDCKSEQMFLDQAKKELEEQNAQN